MVDSYVGAFRNGNINVIRGLLFRGIKANGRFDRRWVNTRTGEVQSVQAGIDPGLARDMVSEGVRDLSAGQAGTAFLDFLFGAVDGDWPVAIAPQAALDRIGSRSRTVRLSSGSVPDYEGLEAEDWLRVQRILDEGGTLDEDGRT